MPHITLRIHSPRIAFLLGLSLALLPGTAQAQFPPDSFTNLQVLPEDIGTRELIGTMRSFALGLGVRCSFCHVGEEGRPLATFDFAADDKAEKLKAREMIRMAPTMITKTAPTINLMMLNVDEDKRGKLVLMRIRVTPVTSVAADKRLIRVCGATEDGKDDDNGVGPT